MRRVHVHHLTPGRVELEADGAHHLRNVLRLTVGTEVELFDDGGSVAVGTISAIEPQVVVEVSSVTRSAYTAPAITVASAIPKGERADWMIEKLSELGCARFIPLATARSVVLPEGKNKLERWRRIATEAAKQSRRAGVMTVDELSRLNVVAEATTPPGLALSTDPNAKSLLDAIECARKSLTLFIGPEGGWTDNELRLFEQNAIRAAKLTDTVLRIETAAIAACTVAATRLASNPKSTI